MVNPARRGMLRLSFKGIGAASAAAPRMTPHRPIQQGRPGIQQTAGAANTTNAIDPSNVLVPPQSGIRPKRRPMSAAAASPIRKRLRLAAATGFEKQVIVRTAEINTQVAPLMMGVPEVGCSLGRIIKPKQRLIKR